MNFKLILYILIYYLIINIIAFFMMYFDKKAAINSEWRIKESSLFGISLLGGGLGSFLGMKKFRHKTKHMNFVIFIPIIAILNLACLYYIYTLLADRLF